ncbi:MAG: hypothetical protein KGL39_30585 [Patescibacteria group bacterium]|nr:hypothetical protein [Patescibacteria group bacterium]
MDANDGGELLPSRLPLAVSRAFFPHELLLNELAVPPGLSERMRAHGEIVVDANAGRLLAVPRRNFCPSVIVIAGADKLALAAQRSRGTVRALVGEKALSERRIFASIEYDELATMLLDAVAGRLPAPMVTAINTQAKTVDFESGGTQWRCSYVINWRKRALVIIDTPRQLSPNYVAMPAASVDEIPVSRSPDKQAPGAGVGPLLSEASFLRFPMSQAARSNTRLAGVRVSKGARHSDVRHMWGD